MICGLMFLSRINRWCGLQTLCAGWLVVQGIVLAGAAEGAEPTNQVAMAAASRSLMAALSPARAKLENRVLTVEMRET